MASTWRLVTGEFRFEPIVHNFPVWLKDACTAFFISAEFPLASVPANDNRYVLLRDIAQEARIPDPRQVESRCLPYRAEVKQSLGAVMYEPIVQEFPDWIRDTCAAFFVASDVLARSAPFNDEVFIIQDVASKELNERTNDLYNLLRDIVQEARVTDNRQVEERCMPYRAEVKQLVAYIEALAVQRQQQEGS